MALESDRSARGRQRLGTRTARTPREGWRTQGSYEYRVVTIGQETSRSDARRLLTEEAEYGRWELARTRL